MMDEASRNKGRENINAKGELSGYVEENKDKLERIALYGNVVTSAMALALLEKR